ncbi:MAG TPA: hypothetical protein VEA38_23075 [Terriglobales bacterium]|nr:hypothetical protein [Terriglobales bacterium]
MDRECRFCGAVEGEAPFKLPTTCMACERYRYRTVGLTPCCDLLPVRLGSTQTFYCQGCPGEDRVPVMLIAPNGSERTSYHPPTARVGAKGMEPLTLLTLAKRRHLNPSTLVLHSADPRSWTLGRLVVVPRDVRQIRRVLADFRCEECGQPARRRVAVHLVTSTKLCLPCAGVRKARSIRKGKLQWRERNHGAHTCPLCERSGRHRLVDGKCETCWKLIRDHGACACGMPKIRNRQGAGQPARCSRCEPEVRRLSPSCTITVTDGERFSPLTVKYTTRIGGTFAGCWIAPVVLVPSLPQTGGRVVLRGMPVIGGVSLPGAGQATRLALEVLNRTRPTSRAAARSALAREWGTVGEANSLIAGLTRSGLLDANGLTDRARAVLRWAEAAGVRL